VLPIWELQFGDLAQGTRPIATEKVKHDLEYQERHGVVEGPAKGLPQPVQARINNLVKRICRTLELDGYARIDFRLADDGTPYFIEANPNPEIARIEEFARSAQHDGLKYPDLLNRILTLGVNRAKPGSLAH
jgi:D-alanine-D-alanine ligase